MMINCPQCQRKLQIRGQDIQTAEDQKDKSVRCKCGQKLTIEKNENSSSDDS